MFVFVCLSAPFQNLLRAYQEQLIFWIALMQDLMAKKSHGLHRLSEVRGIRGILIKS